MKKILAQLPVLLILAALTPAYAQHGSIRGVVVDAQSGETLIGANVVLQGTTTGATTDLDGRYEVRGVTPGLHSVVFTYIGYVAQVVQNVDVRDGGVAELNISLVSETRGLEEVIVEAEAVRNAEAALLRDRQRATAVSDAISAEAMGRSGSSTAGDAMKKVTGVSVVDGRYVYVRGLGERYMNTQLNGAALPSADPDRNAVPLDLFPAGLLDNIVTTKSFTPDKPGDFTGGSLNIATRAYPEAFTFSFSSTTSYNSELGWGERYLSFAEGQVGLTASSRRFNLMQVVAVLGGVPTIDEARRNPEKATQLDRVSRLVNPEMTPTSYTVPINQSYSASVGGRLSLFGRPLGVVTGMNYSRNTSGYRQGTTARYSLEGRVDEVNALTPRYILSSDQSGTQEALLGVMANLTYKPHRRHEIGFNFLHNRSDESRTRFQSGDVFRQLITDGVARTYETRVMKYIERTLSTYQVRGSHAPGGSGVRFEWNTSLARTWQSEPDARYFSSDFGQDVAGTSVTYDINAPAVYDLPTRYFRDLDEQSRSATGDLRIPIRVAGQEIKAKFGASYLDKSRSFREHRFTIERDNATSLSPRGMLRYDGDATRYFSTAGLYDTLGTGAHPLYIFGNYLADHGASGDYDGDERVAAGYGMVEVPVTDRLRFIGGARYEATRIDVRGLVAGKDTMGTIDEADLLPSVSLVYALRPDMNLRAAYGRTLARPTFREMAPYYSYEFIGDVILVGNPTLQQAKVHNYDLRLEWFMRPGEIVAVSGFYKDFSNPIERVYVPLAAGSSPEVTYENVPAATVYGLEFEARKRLDRLVPALRGVYVGGNLTVARSAVAITESELREIRAQDPTFDRTSRPLQGQSPYVLNLDFGYSSPRGTEISAFYNVFGARMSEIVRGASPALYEQPRNVLDLTASQKIGYGVSVKAGLKNALNTPIRVTQLFRGEEYVNREYRTGRVFSLGFGYTF